MPRPKEVSEKQAVQTNRSIDITNRPKLGSYIRRDPLLPAVSFIADRFSFRATGRGSSIARRAISKLKGLTLIS